MVVDFHTHVVAQGFLQDIRHMAADKADMMLKSVFADVVHQLLQMGHLAVGHAALGGDGLRPKTAFAHIHLHFTRNVVGCHPQIGHIPGGHLPFAGAEAVFLAQGGAQNILIGVKNMKKTLAVVTLLAMTTSLLAGCGGGNAASDSQSTAASSQTTTTETASQTEDTGEVTSIRFYGSDSEYNQNIVAGFEAENPDIQVEIVPVDFDNAEQVIKTGISSGDPVDVSFFWGSQINAFTEDGMALDLTPYLTENDNEWLNTFVPANAKHPEEAVRFIRYYTSDPAMQEIINSGRLPSTLSMQDKVQDQLMVDLLATGVGDNVVGYKQMQGLSSEINSYLQNDLIGAVCTGTSVDDAVAQLEELRQTTVKSAQ